jgi:hypothetical protein
MVMKEFFGQRAGKDPTHDIFRNKKVEITYARSPKPPRATLFPVESKFSSAQRKH